MIKVWQVKYYVIQHKIGCRFLCLWLNRSISELNLQKVSPFGSINFCIYMYIYFKSSLCGRNHKDYNAYELRVDSRNVRFKKLISLGVCVLSFFDFFLLVAPLGIFILLFHAIFKNWNFHLSHSRLSPWYLYLQTSWKYFLNNFRSKTKCVSFA